MDPEDRQLNQSTMRGAARWAPSMAALVREAYELWARCSGQRVRFPYELWGECTALRLTPHLTLHHLHSHFILCARVHPPNSVLPIGMGINA